jgi:hypothetical protein
MKKNTVYHHVLRLDSGQAYEFVGPFLVTVFSATTYQSLMIFRIQHLHDCSIPWDSISGLSLIHFIKGVTVYRTPGMPYCFHSVWFTVQQQDSPVRDGTTF